MPLPVIGRRIAPTSTRTPRLLKWLTVVGPVAFLAVVDLVRHLVLPEYLHTLSGTVVLLLVLLAATAAFSRLVLTTHERLQETILRQDAELVALRERDRIGRELQDGVMQSLYGVGLGLQLCRQVLPERGDQAVEPLNRALAQLDEVVRSLRGYVLALRPVSDAAANLGTALDQAVAEFRAQTLVPVELRGDPVIADDLATAQRVVLVDLARAALRAFEATGPGGSMLIELQRNGSHVELWLTRVGPSSSDHSPAGWRALGERVRALGGLLRVERPDARTTRLRLGLPVSS